MPEKGEQEPKLSKADERALDRANDRIGRENRIPPPVNRIPKGELAMYLERAEAGEIEVSEHWIAVLKERLRKELIQDPSLS